MLPEWYRSHLQRENALHKVSPNNSSLSSAALQEIEIYGGRCSGKNFYVSIYTVNPDRGFYVGICVYIYEIISAALSFPCLETVPSANSDSVDHGNY